MPRLPPEHWRALGESHNPAVTDELRRRTEGRVAGSSINSQSSESEQQDVLIEALRLRGLDVGAINIFPSPEVPCTNYLVMFRDETAVRVTVSDLEAMRVVSKSALLDMIVQRIVAAKAAPTSPFKDDDQAFARRREFTRKQRS